MAISFTTKKALIKKRKGKVKISYNFNRLGI